MARLKKWWAAPLLPISYSAASRLLTPPPPDHNDHSTISDPTHHPRTVRTVTKEQFKKGHLMNEFVRFIPGKDGDAAAGKLQHSIVRYKERLPGQVFNPNLTVDLVSVINVADRQYYEELQERLENYDIVMCYGVEGVEGVEDIRKLNPQYFQEIISRNIQLITAAHRLSLVVQGDYLRSRPNWKVINSNWNTIQYLKEEKDKCFAMTPLHDRIFTSLQHFGYQLRSRPWQIIAPFPMPYVVYLASSCNDPVLGSVDVLEDILKLGMFSRFAAWKFWQAWRYSILLCSDKDLEDTSGLGQKRNLIDYLNKAAMKELTGAINRGEHSIAMLYGAPHMPDFHKRLTEELDLVPTSMEWITVWSLEKGPKSKYIQPFLNKFPSEKRTLILTSLIFASLIAHISAWRAFGISYLSNLILINFLAYLLRQHEF